MAKKHAWYVCPNCRSRVAVAQDDAGEVRCRNCSTLLRPAKHTGSATGRQQSEAAPSREDDEYRLAPLSGEQPSPAQGHTGQASQSSAADLQNLRVRRKRLADGASVGAPPATGVTPATLRFDEIEIRDDQRYKPEPPPRWTFFSGVFTYPWRPQSLLPWVVLSIGGALCEWSGMLVVSGLASSSQPGALSAGAFGIVWIWLVILTGSYAAACVFAVMETSAYNYDAPYDWPEPDWRDRFLHFLWMGWCLGLAVGLCITPSTFLSETLRGRALMSAIGIGIAFPVFVLSTMETNSLVAFSGPIWRSLASQPLVWITFYGLSSLLLAGCGLASVVLFSQLQWLSPLALGPLWAAAILIYARLLGRLAWRIMQPGETQLQAWRKAHQSTLAGDLRKREREQDNVFEE